MQKQEHRILECIDGRCPPDIDLVKEIRLTPLEKRAIFFCLQNEVDKARNKEQDTRNELRII